MGARRTRSAIYPREVPSVTLGNQPICTERRHSLGSVRESSGSQTQMNENVLIARAPQVETKQELALRRRRQRKLKKLEQMQEKQERKTREIKTIPGNRIYQLPGRVRPISLFIRLGSLNNDQEVIPIEFFDLMSSSDVDSGDYPNPHPAALAIRSIFHLDDPDLDEEEEEETDEVTESKTAAPGSGSDGKGSRRTCLRRPISVHFPLPSALKKPTLEGPPKRPKSLRILDPRDQKLYEAVAHKLVPADGTPEGDEVELSKQLRHLGLDDGDKYPKTSQIAGIEIASNDSLITEAVKDPSKNAANEDFRSSFKSRPELHPNAEDENASSP